MFPTADDVHSATYIYDLAVLKYFVAPKAKETMTVQIMVIIKETLLPSRIDAEKFMYICFRGKKRLRQVSELSCAYILTYRLIKPVENPRALLVGITKNAKEKYDLFLARGDKI